MKKKSVKTRCPHCEKMVSVSLPQVVGPTSCSVRICYECGQTFIVTRDSPKKEVRVIYTR